MASFIDNYEREKERERERERALFHMKIMMTISWIAAARQWFELFCSFHLFGRSVLSAFLGHTNSAPHNTRPTESRLDRFCFDAYEYHFYNRPPSLPGCRSISVQLFLSLSIWGHICTQCAQITHIQLSSRVHSWPGHHNHDHHDHHQPAEQPNSRAAN